MDSLRSKDWKSGGNVYINRMRWGEPELQKIKEVLDSDWFAGNSHYNKRFEDKLTEIFDVNFIQSTNSGSAALELAVQALIQSGRWKRGDKILHPALTFPTSISAAIMAGLVPVFVDVDPGTYNISTEGIKKAFREHRDIKGAIIPLLLGNVPNMDVLLEGLKGRPLIVDSCDTVGSLWNDRDAVTYGTIFATSFYGSHIISSAGVGGAVGTNDEHLYQMMKSMTFWGRDVDVDKKGKLYSFINRYSYSTIGFDAQMSALQAAFGLAQLDRLRDYQISRREMMRELGQIFIKQQKNLIHPTRSDTKSDPVWFGYCVTIKKGAQFTREDFVTHLLDNNIEMRPIFCNLLAQKPYKNIKHHRIGNFKNTEEVAAGGIFMPLTYMKPDEKKYYYDTIKNFLRKYE